MGSTNNASAHMGRALILCVDNNQTVLRLIDDILVKNGYAVLLASTAEDAMEMFREAPVSLVIADHMLRGATGTELAARFKALKPSVPIVLHSGTNPDRVRHLDAFIHKGEPVETFLTLIRDLVKRFSS